MLPQQIAFGVLSAAMVLAALRVVTTKNVVHAALFLTMVLAGAAGLFILLAAEFVAIVQVLVYVGAIVVLFLFGIMLTRAPIGRAADLDNDQRWLAAIVALFLRACWLLCSSTPSRSMTPTSSPTRASGWPRTRRLPTRSSPPT